MPDIQLRFHQDMLVLSAPVEPALHARGYDAAESEVLLATESETVAEPMRLEMAAGAQCLVLPTSGITRARLAHIRAEDRAAEIALAALGIASALAPQHVIAEIGPTGLPIDPSSRASLTANRDQYADAARLFPAEHTDALFFNALSGTSDLRCALMGARMVWDGPVFASVQADEQGRLPGHAETIEDALAVMEEYGASVAGIQTKAGPQDASALLRRMASCCSLPLLVQLDVDAVCARDPHDGNEWWCADLAMRAVEPLRCAGAQFLRACGKATPSYTGALVAASAGLDAVVRA